MRKLIPGYLIIALAGILLFEYSCTPGSCFENTESFLKASFYDDITKELRAPDSLTVYGLNMESAKIYNKTPNIQTALLPLNPATDNCAYIIIINGITDTLIFRYNSYPHLVSKECGYTYYHNIDPPELTTNTIKYIYLNKSPNICLKTRTLKKSSPSRLYKRS